MRSREGKCKSGMKADYDVQGYDHQYQDSPVRYQQGDDQDRDFNQKQRNLEPSPGGQVATGFVQDHEKNQSRPLRQVCPSRGNGTDRLFAEVIVH